MQKIPNQTSALCLLDARKQAHQIGRTRWRPMQLFCSRMRQVCKLRPHLHVGVEAGVAEGLQAHEGSQATHRQAHGRACPEQEQRQQAQRRTCTRTSPISGMRDPLP